MHQGKGENWNHPRTGCGNQGDVAAEEEGADPHEEDFWIVEERERRLPYNRGSRVT